jgi:hypothetical protein
MEKENKRHEKYKVFLRIFYFLYIIPGLTRNPVFSVWIPAFAGMTIYARNYLFLRYVLYPEKAHGILTVLTLRASLDLQHPRRCGPLAVLTVSGDTVPLRVPRLASAANQTRAISGLRKGEPRHA